MNKTSLLCGLLRCSGILAARGMAARLFRAQNMTVLAYHRVLPEIPEDFPFDRDVISCLAEEFDREIGFVKKHFDVISFRDIDLTRPDSRLNPLIVTFDDGYKDNHDVVMPILKKHGVPATFFITTGYVETSNVPWWDEVCALVMSCKIGEIVVGSWKDAAIPIRTLKEKCAAISSLLRVIKVSTPERRNSILDELRAASSCEPLNLNQALFMNWDDIHELSNSGMEIGSHTISHSVLSHVDDLDQLRSELIGSKKILEERLGDDVAALSYPVGGRESITEDVVRVVRDAGYKFACLYEHGVNLRLAFDPLHLYRIKAEVGTDFTRFRAKVLFPGWIKY